MFSSDKKLEYLDFKGDSVFVHLTLVRCFGLTHKKLAAKWRVVNRAPFNQVIR
jgi:hypothetical protein